MTELFQFSIKDLLDLGSTAIIAFIAIYFLFLIAKSKKFIGDNNGEIKKILTNWEENHFVSIAQKLERIDEKVNKVEKIDEKLDNIITILEIIKERIKNRNREGF